MSLCSKIPEDVLRTDVENLIMCLFQPWSPVWSCLLFTESLLSLQQIDEMLAGSLSQEDEDAVLAELEAITQVGLIIINCEYVYTWVFELWLKLV